jgi:hypothetical protein
MTVRRQHRRRTSISKARLMLAHIFKEPSGRTFRRRQFASPTSLPHRTHRRKCLRPRRRRPPRLLRQRSQARRRTRRPYNQEPHACSTSPSCRRFLRRRHPVLHRHLRQSRARGSHLPPPHSAPAEPEPLPLRRRLLRERGDHWARHQVRASGACRRWWNSITRR